MKELVTLQPCSYNETEPKEYQICNALRGRVAPLLGVAAFMGAGSEASFANAPDTHATPAYQALEQRYNNYVAQFPNPVYKIEFEEFFGFPTAIQQCTYSNAILGQARYGIDKGKIKVELERKSSIFTGLAVMTSDPTPGPQTPSDQVWEKLSVDCSDMATTDLSLQTWHIGTKTERGKTKKVWARMPSTPSKDLPDWNPKAVKNQASDDPTVNPPLARKDKLSISIPKSKRTQKALKNVFPAIVIHTKSLVSGFEDKQAVILPAPTHKGMRSVNAGARFNGKGGAVSNASVDGYPKYK